MKHTTLTSLCRYIALAIGALFIVSFHARPAAAASNTDEAASVPPVLIPVCVRVLDTRCGLLDRDGQWAVEPRYSAIYATADGWRIDEGHSEGMLHPDGKPWIEAKYVSVQAFHNGRAVAENSDGKYGFIDRNGDWAIDPVYSIAKRFSEGLAPVCEWIGGSNSGHSSCHYIDRDGNRAFDGDFEDAEVFSHGLGVVQPPGSNTFSWNGRRIGLIDTKGRTLIDYAARGTLDVINADRVIEQSTKRYALMDRHGKILLEIPRSGFLNNAGSGMLGYKPADGGGFGLRRVDTTEIVVPANKGYLTRTDFENGTATVRFADAGRQGLALIDTQGRVLIDPGTYKYIGDFLDGVGPVSPRGSAWQLADVDGHVLTEARYSQIEPAWKRAMQTPRSGDVWIATPLDAKDTRVWINAKGTILFAREPVDCGIQVIKNNAGDVIWPHDLDTNCAIASGHAPEDASPSTQERIEALQLEHARDTMKKQREWANQMRRDGDDNTPASSSTLQDRIREAPWQRGPSNIELGHGITLTLPTGFQYLSSDYVPALRGLLADQMGRIEATDQQSDFALIARDDMNEMMRIAVYNGRWLDEIRQAGTPKTMVEQAEQGARYLPGMDDVEQLFSDKTWIRRPRWSEVLGQLSWAYSKFNLGMSDDGTVSVDGYGFANSISFFDRDAVIIQAPTGMSVLAMDSATRVAMADVDRIAAGLRRTGQTVPEAAASSAPSDQSSGDTTPFSRDESGSDQISIGQAMASLLVIGVLIGLGVFASRR